jgi:hypothetical protein
MTPAHVPWVVKPWVAEACVTELDGKIKASGKTTLLTIMCRAVLDGRDFLGQPTIKSPVVYLTEQSNISFREALRRADLLDREDFMILSLHETMRIDFRDIVEAAVGKAIEVGAKVIVVDTLARWARLRGDSENSAGDGAEAVEPLKEAAAAHGLAVVFARHERKAGGAVGDAARGSSAIGGEVDVILSLRRPVGQHRETVREIQSLSRFDETPENLLVELTDGAYVALGTSMAVERNETVEEFLRVLPRTEGAAMTLKQIELETGRSRSTLQRSIASLEGAGQVRHTSGGGRNPVRYWQVAPEVVADFDGAQVVEDDEGDLSNDSGDEIPEDGDCESDSDSDSATDPTLQAASTPPSAASAAETKWKAFKRLCRERNLGAVAEQREFDAYMRLRRLEVARKSLPKKDV